MMFWQPIETAPTTPESCVVTWAPDCPRQVTRWDAHDKRWFGLNYEPTHWTYLPLPPDQEEPGRIILGPPEVTLRDHFAMAALPQCVRLYLEDVDKPSLTECAELAYRFADAMLKERDQ